MDGADVYSIPDTEDAPTLDTVVYVGPPSPVADEVSDDDYDAALRPDVVRDREGWLAYRGELLEDVVAVAVRARMDVSDTDLLEAVRYYDEHDAFYSFLDSSANR